ncbi:hypothetical protein B488_04920 [Liberibacter crescens BT-1]|uniref:Fido domain-containing protein n=1 Tax=Liberibacter crescens (strain BT-1) TaxID=1215343 RepID=L0ESK0_LIBCB|nr:Fic/DOC family N-terminal domain-containing protein [Liberibacter crescens]AGA64484.1 hypothetical protein B488_04920 [Liberibacter crescens BT-1]AMC13334.1 hypothetical protein RL73_02575 [Liberibacter crescens]
MPPVHYRKQGFPPKNIDILRLSILAERAAASVSRYDGFLHVLPNPVVFMFSLTTREAIFSTRIEGTRAEIDEVLEFEAEEKDKSINPDYEEVINYRNALILSTDKILEEKLPICGRVMREAHKVLMQGVRGRNKSPGLYRREPVWIGNDIILENAKFIPCNWPEIEDAMGQLEEYINSDRIPYADYIKLAIIHAEFECIHPFLDGNGRLGRLLIPLIMFYYGLITSPCFYISAYLEQNRDMYYENLLSVSRDGNWQGWIEFFLKAVEFQGKENFRQARKIWDLYGSLKERVLGIIKSPNGIRTLDFIFEKPAFTSTQLREKTNLSETTAKDILKIFQKAGIILKKQNASGNKPALYIFPEFYQILQETNQYSGASE